jgi:hypothetical protein
MRVLITGDREWYRYTPIYQVLRVLFHHYPDSIVVEGDARGADQIAGHIVTEFWGKEHLEVHPADWVRHKKAAGPIRNQYMIDESKRRAERDGHELRYAVAFHRNLRKSKGTKDMVYRCEQQGIDVLKITG